VELEFSSKHLDQASLDFSVSSRIFGVQIGRKYIQRLAILRAVGKFSQLYGIQSLRLHPLKGNRAGQYPITLTGNYRLIVEKAKEDKVLIVDVEDYHGD
jgi:proteic killer suppression protein